MLIQSMALITLTWSAVSAADSATIGLVFRGIAGSGRCSHVL